jgi:tripartite-type tricarboxylate transporter receptor subunit TctC
MILRWVRVCASMCFFVPSFADHWEQSMWRGLLRFVLVTGLASAPASAAENDTNHPITIVMGMSAGGIADVTTRLYANAVSKELGQEIRIDNRPTEGGTIAAAAVQNAAADGYTLLVLSGAQHAALAALRPVPYQPVSGFAPVTTLFTLVNFLAVPFDSPAHSVGELLELGRRKPGGLVFGSSGLGSTSHLTAAQLALSRNAPIKALHYAGAAPMIGELIAGRLDFTLVSATLAKPYLSQGRLRLLAVDADERWPDLSTIPTLREAGVSQPKVASWFALAAPAGTPKAVIHRLHDAFANASRDPAVVKGLRDNGALVTINSPEATKMMLSNEVVQAAALVQLLNLRQ